MSPEFSGIAALQVATRVLARQSEFMRETYTADDVYCENDRLDPERLKAIIVEKHSR